MEIRRGIWFIIITLHLVYTLPAALPIYMDGKCGQAVCFMNFKRQGLYTFHKENNVTQIIIINPKFIESRIDIRKANVLDKIKLSGSKERSCSILICGQRRVLIEFEEFEGEDIWCCPTMEREVTTSDWTAAFRSTSSPTPSISPTYSTPTSSYSTPTSSRQPSSRQPSSRQPSSRSTSREASSQTSTLSEATSIGISYSYSSSDTACPYCTDLKTIVIVTGSFLVGSFVLILVLLILHRFKIVQIRRLKLNMPLMEMTVSPISNPDTSSGLRRTRSESSLSQSDITSPTPLVSPRYKTRYQKRLSMQM